MSAIISKATNFVNNAITKTTELTHCTIYWSKVTAEITTTVFKKEGLAPPSQAQFQEVYKKAVATFYSPEKQRELYHKVLSIKPTKENAAKFGVYGVHLLGFFSLGEIIGRRSIFGYPTRSIVAHH